MRIVWSALIVGAAGCGDPRGNRSEPPAVVETRDDPQATLPEPPAVVKTRGEVQQGLFSADSRAFLGWVTPAGKDPAAERLKPIPWVLWSAANGTEVARWTGNPMAGFEVPGAADGADWPALLPGPPKSILRYRLLNLAAGAVRDVPGVTGPAESGTRPSYSADRTRLAYSDYAADADRRTGRVYQNTAAGWTRVVEVPGEKAVLSPDGTLVATVGRKPAAPWTLHVRLFAVADGKERWSAAVDSYGLHGFTPDGRYVIQADNAGHRLLDAATGKQMVLVANGPRGDSHGPAAVAYRAGWVAAVVRSGESAVLVRWDVAAGKEVSRTPTDCPFGHDRTPPFSSPRLPVVRPAQTQRVPGRPDASRSSMAVDIYDPAAIDPVARLTLGDPGSVIASPDGRTLAAVGYSSLTFHPLPVTK